MTFEDGVFETAAKVHAQKDAIKTEEATKNAFVMPFISRVLGYDVFNPLEVIPEFTADVGTKKGEKVDYAIMRDGEVQMLIECKQIGDRLDINHASQLFRYFSVTNSRIGVLTNGQVYNFYTDLDAPNIMDSKPFLVLDLLDIEESLLPELKKLSRDAFNLESVLTAAEELKYVGAIKREISAQFQQPERELVRFFMSKVTERRATVDNLALFTELTAKSLKQYLKEQVNDRLKVALGDTEPTLPVVVREDPAAEAAQQSADEVVEAAMSDVVTTEEELAGYQIVKAIACSEVKPQRIVHRDSKSYFAIILDDNNRKPIARLHFNRKSKKYLGVFDTNKVETRHELTDLDDIYSHADAIRSIVNHWAGASN